MPLRPALQRDVLAAVAMLAALVASGMTTIWLVLAPVLPTGAASAQLRQPSEAAATVTSGPSSEALVVESDAPVTRQPGSCRSSYSW